MVRADVARVPGHPGRHAPPAPRVPRLLLLTDRRQLPRGCDLVAQVVAAVTGGVDGVVLRERDLPDGERTELFLRLRAALRHAAPGVPLLYAGPPPREATGHDGVHLRSSQPVPAVEPVAPAAPPPRRPLVGRSCHGPGDLQRARRDGCDYVSLSPVAVSASKPGHGPPLGPQGLGRMVAAAGYDRTAPRVLALGGVTAGSTAALVRAGAHGVAVMGALMRTGRPAVTAAALRAAVGP